MDSHSAIFIECIEHRLDVFGRHIRHDIVDRIEDKPTTWGQSLDVLTNVIFDLPRGTTIEHRARIAASAPESDLIAKLFLQAGGFHIPGGGLDRVDHVITGLDQVGEQAID